MIDELLARCPDRATESVLADWCEENERAFLVRPLRSDDAEHRAAAVAHLAQTFHDEITLEKFHIAWTLFRSLNAAWDAIATSLVMDEPEATPATHFISRYTSSGGSLDDMWWTRAVELIEGDDPERELPFAELPRRACPACGRAALLVGSQGEGTDPDGSPGYYIELRALCLFGPHAETVTRSTSWHSPIPPK